jgi:cation/acetate symporter
VIYQPSITAVIVFVVFVLVVLVLSSYLARRTKSAHSYFAAGGTIHWGVNGIAFAGDYLSAASFLGICGMIATAGYDGFLYSIGYLAGWVVALFVVAEPMKRLGRYTFTDALNANFRSSGIQLATSISTLVVSVCYLIPQMVGAGDLVTPLLGLPHYMGVIMVGAIVIFIVATAGMTSTTYVQFLKGGLLIVFSTIMVVMVVRKGLDTRPQPDYHQFATLPVTVADGKVTAVEDGQAQVAAQMDAGGRTFVKLNRNGVGTWWVLVKAGGTSVLQEALAITRKLGSETLYNGEPKAAGKFFQVGHVAKVIEDGAEVSKTGPTGPFGFLSAVEKSTVVRFGEQVLKDGDSRVTVYYQNPTPGKLIVRPGLKFKVDKGATFWTKLNFVSLMLALFFGTSALPHILIRYYTVPSAKCARKSTIVAIAAIGFFYILTLFLGLGAMVNGVLDVESSNMAAPLLAKSFGKLLFAIISAVAFATILGTVSGLIVAASGAVAHDLIDMYWGIRLSDRGKVLSGKIAAIAVGAIAIVLGILMKGMNVSFLVGLAFAVAASANLPAILMMIFWQRTTGKGIAASVIVGMVSSLAIILLSPTMFAQYGLDPKTAPIPLDNPGIVSIPLSFIVLVVVSLLTEARKEDGATVAAAAAG